MTYETKLDFEHASPGYSETGKNLKKVKKSKYPKLAAKKVIFMVNYGAVGFIKGIL